MKKEIIFFTREQWEKFVGDGILVDEHSFDNLRLSLPDSNKVPNSAKIVDAACEMFPERTETASFARLGFGRGAKWVINHIVPSYNDEIYPESDRNIETEPFDYPGLFEKFKEFENKVQPPEMVGGRVAFNHGYHAGYEDAKLSILKGLEEK